jgi:hypothetical protein
MHPATRVGFVVALIASACSVEYPTPTTPRVSDSTPTDGGPPSTPRPAILTGPHTVSGVITERTAQGLAPSAGAYVLAWITQPQTTTALGFSYWHANGVVTDEAGRYLLSGLPVGVTVRLYVSKGSYTQQCATPLLMITGDMKLDAEVVAPDGRFTTASAAPAPAPGYRIVSGRIYEMAGDVRRPVVGAWLEYYPVTDLAMAVTVTDAEGRFLFCGVPTDRAFDIGVFLGKRFAYESFAAGESSEVDVLLPLNPPWP